MTEHTIQDSLLRALNTGPFRFWRRNSGTAWQGSQRWNPDGSLVLRSPRAILAGEPGMLDYQGFVVVGGVAVYAELEVKRPGKKPEPHQRDRITILRRMGAIAEWADSVEMALEKLNAHVNR